MNESRRPLPTFERASRAIGELTEIAWRSYQDDRKAPRTVPAGRGYHDPGYQLSVEWLATREQIRKAQRRHDQRAGPTRVLLINGSSRNDQTCPGEMSKTHRLLTIAREVLDRTRGIETDLLDLSRLTAEYGRVIYPCKACVSTAMPLCHWPCSCYPITGRRR